MKIALTNPPWRYQQPDGSMRYGVRAGSRWPFTKPNPDGYMPFPFYLAHTKTYLDEHGITDNIFVDSIAAYHDYDKFYSIIAEAKPEYVLIETSTPSVKKDLEVALTLKTRGHKIIMTGPHITTYAEKMAEEYPWIDHFIKGEYEIQTYNLLSGKTSEKILGIYLTPNLDELGYSYRDGAVIWNYYDNPLGCRGRQIVMSASRGCAYRCVFCQWIPLMYQNKYRIRSVEHVIGEMDSLLRRFGRGIHFYFDGDTENQSEKWMQKFCPEVKKLGVDWGMMSRADTVSLDTWSLMHESGCKGVKIGIESGSQKLVDACDKRLDLKTVEQVCEHFHKIGMFFHTTWTWGLPGETRETISETKEYFKRLKSPSYQESFCSPLAGTPYFESLKAQGKITDEDFAKFDGAMSHFAGSAELTPQELTQLGRF